MSRSVQYAVQSSWPHRWAWVLACATFPLVWWGGFVTATGSGMAFREWLTPDGAFMPFYPWLSSAGDKFIEHGHRLLAMVAGLLTIGLVVVTFRCESRPWVRGYSVALLAGVIGQGILGGMRVVLDQRTLALVHGCVGPLFFAACAGMVTITSPQWSSEVGGADSPAMLKSRKVLRLALLTAALAYLQLVLGAVVRHSPYMLSERAGLIFRFAVYGHVVVALIVVVQTVRLALALRHRPAPRAVAAGLAGLATCQLMLGFSSWVVKYGMPSWFTSFVGETGHFNRATDVASAAIVTAHGAVGALIVALAFVVALRVGRLQRVDWRRVALAGGKGQEVLT